MKKIFFLMAILWQYNAQAQAIINQGYIKYEVRTNMHKVLNDRDNNGNWMQEMLKRMPKYYYAHFDLFFNEKESYYVKSKTQPEQDEKAFGWFKPNNDNNAVYKNLDSNKIVMTKEFFETKMLLKDSLPQAQWKLTNEFRKIANYNCRKATTIIMDSLYVIAYYTDAITTNSGPESVNGLPGMILGVVVPRLHTNIFATVIDPSIVTKDKIQVPTKGTAMDYAKATSNIEKVNKNWEDNKASLKKMIWGFFF